MSADEWSVGRFLATLDNMENGFFVNSQVTGEDLSVSQSARLAFIHLDASDAIGHAASRESPISKSSQYRSLLHQFDGFLSKITRKLKRVSEGLNVRVAFVLTADHGMTDSDGHGGDSLQETITPLLVWGAGLVGPRLSESSFERHLFTQTDSYGFPVQIEGRQVNEIQQVDLCPLMAALLGIPIPKNSRGRLPLALVNSSDPVKFQMIRANCLQLIAQLQVKLEEKRRSYFMLFFMEYGRLTQEDVANRMQRAETLGAKREYADAIEQYSQLEELTIAALDYYDTYDRKFFRIFVGLSCLLWSLEILCSMLGEVQAGQQQVCAKPRPIGICQLFLCGYGTVIFVFAYSRPVSHTVCQIMPLVFALHLAWSRRRQTQLLNLIKGTAQGMCQAVCTLKTVGPLASFLSVAPRLLIVLNCVCILELLIWGFSHRSCLSAASILVSIWPLLDRSFGRGRKTLRFLWPFACILLAVFPLLPVSSSIYSPFLVTFGGLTLSVISAVFVWRVFISTQLQVKCRYAILPFVMSFFVAVAGLAVLVTRSSTSVAPVARRAVQLFSWSSLVLPLFLFVLVPKKTGHRLFYWITAWMIPYILLSVGYEVLFLGVFLCVGLLWIQMELPNMAANKLWDLETACLCTRNNTLQTQERLCKFETLRRALFFIFLLIVIFFGIADVSTLNKLDIRITYCFVTQIEHGSVVYFAILKILLPLLCLGIIGSAIQTHGNQESSAPYEALVTLAGCCTILSNLFIVQFFMWLRVEGSWLAIGTSIAHYGIAMGISLLTFVLLFIGLGMLCLEFPMKLCMSSRQSFHTLDPL
ncbi:hypothetical protein CRM22_007755 [Opisthorchis felineus]|uniref:GPI ethanolamine phosphate transferase 1 n=2 Tax=Opisthorchis felineus TaxID=147828 RepID=A0A4S2LEI7_OPIFE|nr:hypothetical protein CRM22_007755 [Opisthorchis felineus]